MTIEKQKTTLKVYILRKSGNSEIGQIKPTVSNPKWATRREFDTKKEQIKQKAYALKTCKN